MANGRNVTARIGLEGGKEVEAQLRSLGDVGSAAFGKIRDAVNANDSLKQFGPTLDALSKKAGAVGKAFSNAGEAFGEFGTSLKDAGKAIGIATGVVGALVGGLVAFVKTSADSVDGQRKMAEALGITTEQLSNLTFTADQAGVGAEGFTKALTRLSKAADESQKAQFEVVKKQRTLGREFALGRATFDDYQKGMEDLQFEAGNTATVLDRLGVSTKGANGQTKDARTLLLDTADAFKRLPDGPNKAAIATELFGKSNVKMVGLLNQGRQAIVEYEKEAERVAPALQPLAKDALTDLQDAFSKTKAATLSTKDALAALFAPGLTDAANAITEALVKARPTILAFGAAIADKVTPAVKDLIALLEGRDADVKNDFFLKAKAHVLEFAAAVDEAVNKIILPILGGLLKIAEVIAGAMNGLFGTKFSGEGLAVAAILSKVLGLFGVFGAAIRVVVAIVGLFVAAFGGVPVAIALVVAAIAAFVFNALGGVKGIQDKWNAAWKAIADFGKGIWDGLTKAANDVWEGIKSGAQNIADFFTTTIPETLKGVWDFLVTGAQDAWKKIVDGVSSLGTKIADTFRSALDSVVGFFTDMWNSVKGIFQDFIDGAKKVAAALGFGGGGGDATSTNSPPGFADGGAVRGPGTGRSDSILARLSNGEFVQPWRSVQKYGLRFMEAIRRGTLPAGIARAPGFNTGGLVAGIARGVGSVMPNIPRFADGGLARVGAGATGGGRAVNLHLPGAAPIPLHGSEDAVARLERAAAHGQIRAAGRKPAWFRG